MQEFGLVAGLGLGAVLLFFLAWGEARRRRRLRTLAVVSAPESGAASDGPGEGGADPLLRRLERRMEELEAVQSEIAGRLAILAEEGGAAKLQAMAGSLLGLVRDKNATLETALAGIDGLRARIATLEGIGDLAEARALVEGLTARIDALEAAQARAAVQSEAQAEAQAAMRAEMREEVRGVLAARAEGAGAGPLAEFGEALARLHAQKEAAIETVFARLGPLEVKLAGLEGRLAGLDPEGALARFGERLEAVRRELEARLEAAQAGRGDGQTAAEAAAAAGAAAVAELGEALARLHAQKDAGLETVLARLGPLEARLTEVATRAAGLDPEAALARFGERLDAAREALQAQIDALRIAGAAAGDAAHAEAPLVALSEQLAALYAQKEAAAETVFARLGPVEAKLAALEARVAGLDPEPALARLDERLDGRIAALGERIAGLEAAARVEGEAPRMAERAAERAAEALERMAAIGAEREAALATLMDRLGPVEARLAEVEAAAADWTDPAAREGIARLEGEVAALGARLDQADNGLGARLDRETAALGARLESEVAAIAVRLEAELGSWQEARVALGEEARAARAAAQEAAAEAAALREAGARAEADGIATLGARLTEIHERREAAIEAVFGRLAALEASLAGLDGRVGEFAPRAAVERVDTRIDLVRQRLAVLEETGGKPVEAIAARLQPVEATLGALEGQVRETDPTAALDRFAERLEAARATLQGQIDDLRAESPLAEVSEQLTYLYAQRDVTVETVFARLAPLEAKLSEIEERVREGHPQAALDRLGDRLEAIGDRLASVEEDAPRAALAERLTELHERRDAAVEGLFARFDSIEARLEGMGACLEALDGAAARAEALEAVRARVEALDGIEARVDALDAVSERLSALDEVAARVGAAERAQAGLADRLEAIDQPGTGALAETRAALNGEIEAGLEELRADRAAALAAVGERIGRLEAALAEMETRGLSEAEARAEAQAIAAQLIATRTVAEETRLFANRLSLLEASLPRLSLSQSLMMQALERQAMPWESLTPGQEAPLDAAPAAAAPRAYAASGSQLTGRADVARQEAEDFTEIWRNPRVVSLHHNS